MRDSSGAVAVAVAAVAVNGGGEIEVCSTQWSGPTYPCGCFYLRFHG